MYAYDGLPIIGLTIAEENRASLNRKDACLELSHSLQLSIWKGKSEIPIFVDVLITVSTCTSYSIVRNKWLKQIVCRVRSLHWQGFDAEKYRKNTITSIPPCRTA